MGPQVVLHTALPAGNYSCHAFVTHLATRVLRIVIAPGNRTPAAAKSTQDLGELIRQELAQIHGSPPCAPCGGSRPDPPKCQFSIPDDLLVLVGDGSAPLIPPSWAASWKTVVILHSRSEATATDLLPRPLARYLAVYWTRSLREVVPGVFVRAGITPERPRIFISYKRAETQGLADQLFHALAEAQFDVFLDHCRLPAGVELLARIRHELGDKTMVAALESAHLLDSRWARYEIRVAQTLRLGLFAITVPGGVKLAGLGADRRQEVDHPDFVRGRYTAHARLRKPVMDDLVGTIRRQHDRAVVQRRRQITESMQNALLLEGISTQYFDTAGRLCVQSGPPTHRDYAIWLASRSPDLTDFHRAGEGRAASARAVVVGIARLMERQRRGEIKWLSQTAGVALRDEGRLNRTAAEIAGGSL